MTVPRSFAVRSSESRVPAVAATASNTSLRSLTTWQNTTVWPCHGPGKTTGDAWALIWFLVTRPLSRVVVLAPEFSRQIRAIVFSEVRKCVRRSKVPIPLNVKASRVPVGDFGEEWSATVMGTAGEVRIPDAEVLTADLSAQRYKFTQDGKIKLESKDETRKCAGHSRDRSDAVALAIGGGIAPLVEVLEEWFDVELYGRFVL